MYGPAQAELQSLSGENCGNEILFSPTAARRALGVLTKHGVAVLGVEMMLPGPIGLETIKLSQYEVEPGQRVWADFVSSANELARDFVQTAASEPQHRFIFSTATESEFRDQQSRQ